MWLKRFLICSAAVTGGCNICIWSWNSFANFGPKEAETSPKNAENSTFIYLPENGGNDFDESMESSSVFLRKNILPTYWKLLKLCRSKDHKIRLKAVDSLSKLTSLEKWQYVVIAQACDIDTSIGLARSHNASPYFFLPSPFRDLDQGNLQNELFLMLSSLHLSNEDVCIQNLIKQIMKSAELLLKSGYNVDLEIGDPSVIYRSQRKEKAIFLYDKLCLQAILDCSSKSFLRTVMMEKGILKLLFKVLQSHKGDAEIHCLIAQILANLAIEEKFRNCIYATGWIGRLSEWKKSPYINVSLPAAKALANLDTDDIAHPIYEDGVYILNPLCRLSQRNYSADVIFIHGLLGATFWTWRQCDTQRNKTEVVVENENLYLDTSSTMYSTCWPKDWLAVDIPFLRIISVDYKTCISNWGSCCAEMKEKNFIKWRAKELMNKLLLSNVGDKPIIWVAHSMGGLIVKQILSEASESKDKNIQSLLDKTIGLVFYSVPHKGSEIATKLNSASLIFQPSREIGELNKDSSEKLSKHLLPNFAPETENSDVTRRSLSDTCTLVLDSTSLLCLHKKFKDIISTYNIPILSFGETKKSRWGLNISILVPFDSADPGIGEFHTLPVDHLSTCKPISQKSPEYLKVLNFMKENLSRMNVNETNFQKQRNKIFEVSKVMCLIP